MSIEERILVKECIDDIGEGIDKIQPIFSANYFT